MDYRGLLHGHPRDDADLERFGKLHDLLSRGRSQHCGIESLECIGFLHPARTTIECSDEFGCINVWDYGNLDLACNE